MKNEVKTLILLGICAWVSPETFAAEGVTTGVASYGGAGCIPNSARITQVELRTTLELDAFNAGGRPNTSMDRSACNLAIPVGVEHGYQVAIRSLKLQGTSQLSQDAEAKVISEAFFSGSKGKLDTQNLKPGATLFTQTFEPKESELIWSECGKQVIARANTSLTITDASGEDSVRGNLLTLELVSRRCQ